MSALDIPWRVVVEVVVVVVSWPEQQGGGAESGPLLSGLSKVMDY